MKGRSSERWKLGLFVVLGLIAVVGAVLWVGYRAMTRETVTYTTYFGESVGGLSPGAPVLFRGVSVGKVKQVGIAEDGRHIRVEAALSESSLRALKVEPDGTPPPEMRFAIGAGGLTGDTPLEVKFRPPGEAPAPRLGSLTPPDRYVPSLGGGAGGPMEALAAVAEDIGPAVEHLRAALADVERKVAAVDVAGINQQSLATLRSIEGAASTTRELAARLGERAPETLARADSLLRRMERAVARVEKAVAAVRPGETGASLRGAVASVESAAQRLALLGGEAEVTMSTLRGTLEAVKRLADLLERDPNALLLGRAWETGRRPPR